MGDKNQTQSRSTLGDTARAYGNAVVQTARDLFDPTRNTYVRSEARQISNDARNLYSRYKSKRGTKRASSR